MKNQLIGSYNIYYSLYSLVYYLAYCLGASLESGYAYKGKFYFCPVIPSHFRFRTMWLLTSDPAVKAEHKLNSPAKTPAATVRASA